MVCIYFFLSIDYYTHPKNASVVSYSIISGVLYSKRLDKIVWKDTVDTSNGMYQGVAFGLGGYAGTLLMKAMAPTLIYKNHVFPAFIELLKTVPKLPKN